MSESGAKVSVVVCTYNGEKYLREQLQSILAQTTRPDEIIISDDGSTDSTLDVVEEVRSRSDEQEPPVWKVLARSTPLGVSDNFASALVEATGEFIALADQDDVWEENRLEKAVGLLRDNVLLVHSDATLIDASDRPMGTLMSTLGVIRWEREKLLAGRALDVLVKRNVVTGAATMIRASLLHQALPIPKGWIHDEWLALVAAVQGGVVFSDDCLIRYRQHGNNEIGATKTDFTEAKQRLLEKRADFYGRKLIRNEGISAMLDRKPAWLDATTAKYLGEKLEFDLWRSALPSVRAMRVLPVLSRWIGGSYGRFARGYLDVIRDISLKD